MKVYPKNEGIFVCIKSKGLEDELTLHKQYVGYAFKYNHSTYLHVYTDNDPHHLTGIDRFITLEQWRDQQLKEIGV